jgi:crossover junction endodeoxyribonuclease RuvC
LIALGVDPGLSGGLALIESGERCRVIFACAVPVTGEGAKRRVDVGAVLKILQKHKIDHAFIERAQAMPDQGASSGFNYGRAVGALEACVQGMMIPLTFVEASAWKRDHGLIKTQKEDSRQRAIMLFPGVALFVRKMDHNVAEAALIAAHGLRRLLSPTSPAPKPKKKSSSVPLDAEPTLI